MQPNGITVQEVLNRHLSSCCGESVETIGASRTDAGVRPGQWLFDTNARMPGEKISYALNQLPEDIRIQMSKEVADFHPRYRVSEKTYEYRILNEGFLCPQSGFIHFTYIPMDIEKMRKAGISAGRT
ncbi:MAG: hypothetical protein ACLRMZ_02020 [Blautia marasmi]